MTGVKMEKIKNFKQLMNDQLEQLSKMVSALLLKL